MNSILISTQCTCSLATSHAVVSKFDVDARGCVMQVPAGPAWMPEVLSRHVAVVRTQATLQIGRIDLSIYVLASETSAMYVGSVC